MVIVPVDRLRAGGSELARGLAGGAIALARVGSGDAFLVLLLVDCGGSVVARLLDPRLELTPLG